MKKLAVIQSGYIPWKGYFDMIAYADKFIVYDDVQYTKGDWRNRNKIKTPRGAEWLSIPCGPRINRLVKEVEISDQKWKTKHWRLIELNYKTSPFFETGSSFLKSFYFENPELNLSKLNTKLIEIICAFLKIETPITNSSDYILQKDKSERLISFCKQSGCDVYVSGPKAKNYIDEKLFLNNGIEVEWFDYSGYKEYPQLWGEFDHHLSILDLIFNCGHESTKYMNYA